MLGGRRGRTHMSAAHVAQVTPLHVTTSAAPNRTLRGVSPSRGATAHADLVRAYLSRRRVTLSRQLVVRPEWRAEVRRYHDLLARMVPLAVDLRHEPILAVGDGDERFCTCERCSPRGYGNVGEDAVGGALFKDECLSATCLRAGAATADELERDRGQAVQTRRGAEHGALVPIASAAIAAQPSMSTTSRASPARPFLRSASRRAARAPCASTTRQPRYGSRVGPQRSRISRRG